MKPVILWIVTIMAALMMLAGAIYIARQRAAVPVATTVAAPAPIVAMSPVVPEPSVTPQAVTKTVAEKPDVIDEVKIDLSGIAGTLQMSSPDIPVAAAGQLPRYPLELTCYRKNSSPALNWKGAPKNTKSFLLVLERRAPNEKASWPWIMLNVPAASLGLPGKISPESITAEQGLFGTNPYGHQAYTGPCEPKGTFSYVLRLLALDIILPLQAGATLPDILPALNKHVVDAAEIRAEHYLRK